MIPLSIVKPGDMGHKTWRAKLPAYPLRDITNNLMYGNGDTWGGIDVYLDEGRVLDRVKAGDIVAPEDVDLAHALPPDEVVEGVVAWLYTHPESWAGYGPIRLAQEGLKHDSHQFSLADAPDNCLPHLVLTAAMMRRAEIDVEVTFGLNTTVNSIMSQLDLPADKADPVPEALIFGEDYFPLDDLSPEGLMVRVSTRRAKEPQCVLIDHLSEQTVGRYSSSGWEVGFEEPFDRPPSEMGIDMPQGDDESPERHSRKKGASKARHLEDFVTASELFLGNTTSGLREYLLWAMSPPTSDSDRRRQAPET